MSDEKRIKDFEPATELLIDDWFAVDSPSQGTRKMQASMFQEGLQTQITTNTENIALHSGQISVLQQGVGNIGDKVDVLDAAITVEEYSATKLYAVDEDCVYEGVRYKCITAIETPEAFDPNKWQAISIEGELNELNSRLANYVVRYVTWNNTPANYTNGAYYYNDYITDISKSNYTIVSVWAENTKWKMPCFIVLSDVQNANYILRLQYVKSNFPNVSDLANTNVSLRIGYVRNS